MYTVKISRKAENEIQKASEYYKFIDIELEAKLKLELSKKFKTLEGSPHIFQIRIREIRKVVLKTFPYSLYFKIIESQKVILIFRFRHERQDRLYF